MILCSSGSSLGGFANISNNQLNMEMYLHEATCKKLLMEVCNLLSEELVFIYISFMKEGGN